MIQLAPRRVAVVDANVLVPNILRDVFVSLAFERVYAACWTEQIHAEWMRNAARLRPDVPLANFQKVRALMDANVVNSVVNGYEPLIETLQLPDAGDRHVLAAAIIAQAGFIVTSNLRDFPASVLKNHRIQAQSPATFLCELWRDFAPEILVALSHQRQRLRNPPQTPGQFCQSLTHQGLTSFTALLQPFLAQL